jgi:phosphoribosylanthranilate isomerase
LTSLPDPISSANRRTRDQIPTQTATAPIGALGVTHDWSISRRIAQLVRTPVILAGGLAPDNVAEAIDVVRPAGVDSKTKTDQDGSHRKDLDRVRRFNETAKAPFSHPRLTPV